jgi:TRAP-type uncharacterized transport system fused permease subunit
LVKVGVQAHVAHMLAFYFAVLSEVSPPVGLSPSAAANTTGANLLLVGASLGGFILAAVSSSASLFLVSLGIVGYMWGTLHTVDRVLLILAAVVMAIIPIEFSIPGIVPAIIGALIVFRNVIRHRRRVKEDPSKGE